MTAPFTLRDRVEAVTRDGSRIVWTPGEVIGRTLEAPEATRYIVVTDDRQMLKDIPACDVRAS